ncbi:MAG: pyridoxal phosphate-dependent aminotransferase [Bacteroidales bacterium]|nr:pyridoxal phosphate-dependent aminotransferase [Bacteroidales bacterium]
MANISHKAELMPASAIRKLVPLSDAAKAQGIKVYHLNVGAPDIKSPACALDAVKDNTLDHVSYTNSAGLMELRKGMCEKYYRKIGIDLEPKDLLMTVAGSEAVDMALKITCDQGDELVVMEPYYTNYNTFCFMNGITLKAVPTDLREGFKVPPMSEFEKLITPKTKAILISNPGNPTGTLYSKEEVLALGELCLKHDIFLISDEVYREFCYTDQPHFSAMNIPGADQNVILVDSVSKRYNLCGCRLGTIASRNQAVMTAAMKYAQARLCPPVFGQLAALGALDTPQEYFAEVREEYIRRRDFAVNALNAMPGVFSPLPMGAFYTIVEIPVDDAESFCRWMLSEFRVGGETTMVTPAASFYKTPGKGINHVRLAYVLEVEELRKALDILAKGLLAYPGRTA